MSQSNFYSKLKQGISRRQLFQSFYSVRQESENRRQEAANPTNNQTQTAATYLGDPVSNLTTTPDLDKNNNTRNTTQETVKQTQNQTQGAIKFKSRINPITGQYKTVPEGLLHDKIYKNKSKFGHVIDEDNNFDYFSANRKALLDTQGKGVLPLRDELIIRVNKLQALAKLIPMEERFGGTD